MAVKIRLARTGAKKKPFYRVVVADVRSPRDGRFIEVIGRYNPTHEPSLVELDVDKVKDWMAKGAQPTEAVVKLIAIAEGKAKPPKPTKTLSKKAQAKAAEAAKPAAAKAEAPAAAAEEAKAEEPVAEEAPAEEPAAEEAPTASEEPAAAEVAEETPAEEPAAEEPGTEEAPAAEETKAEEG